MRRRKAINWTAALLWTLYGMVFFALYLPMGLLCSPFPVGMSSRDWAVFGAFAIGIIGYIAYTEYRQDH